MFVRSFFFALLYAAWLATHVQAGPPNVLIILGDDQGWGDYGFMGSPNIRTPHLDKLASEGLLFRRGYVPSSLCRPSLATLITGLYPHQHHIMSNDPPAWDALTKGGGAGKAKDGKSKADSPKASDAPADPVTAAVTKAKARAEMAAEFEKSPNLAKLFGAAGYISHQSGKWWEGNACRCGGFTEGMTHGDVARGGRHGDEGLKIGRDGLDEVFAFLDRSKKEEKPFFMWYAPIMPHTPHNPPERLLKKYIDKTPSIHVARYWAMCEWFDETVGELLAKLKANGQDENTIVVFLHDNGWIQDPNKPAYAPKSKQSPNEGGVRTPIVLRWPAQIKPGVSDELAQSIDIAPTVLLAAGLKPTADMPGINLLDAAATKKRDTLYGEIYLHAAVELNKPDANLRYRWLVSDGWKLIVPHERNEKGQHPQLFNVANDPHEERDLAAENPAKVAELTKKLDAWWVP